MAAALCATVSLCLAACDNSVIYDGYVSIAKEGWDKDTLAIFSLVSLNVLTVVL